MIYYHFELLTCEAFHQYAPSYELSVHLNKKMIWDKVHIYTGVRQCEFCNKKKSDVMDILDVFCVLEFNVVQNV